MRSKDEEIILEEITVVRIKWNSVTNSSNQESKKKKNTEKRALLIRVVREKQNLATNKKNIMEATNYDSLWGTKKDKGMTIVTAFLTYARTSVEPWNGFKIKNKK